MARWARAEAAGVPELRAEITAHYDRLLVSRTDALACGRYRRRLKALKADKPVVFASWQLYRFNVPAVKRGVHAYYRVEADGRVVEVSARRSPSRPMSIVGWDPVVAKPVDPRPAAARPARTQRGASR